MHYRDNVNEVHIWFRKLHGILNVLKVSLIVSSFKPLKASGTNVICPALLPGYCDIKDTEEDDELVRRDVKWYDIKDTEEDDELVRQDGKFCIVLDFSKTITAWK